MKYLWFGMVILAVLLVICFGINTLLTSYTTNVQHELNAAIEAAHLQDFTLASVYAKKASEAWNSHLHFYASVLCHDETDEITVSLAELQVIEDAEFLQSAAMLRSRLAHISEMNLPLLHNIL